MTRPQPGIFAEGSTAHYALEYTVGGDGAALAAALISDGNGGAFAMSQQWVHDLDSFNALPADSHVSRTDVKIDGVAQKIWRRSFPYGDTSTKGLYFLSFACDLARFDVQLQRMYGVSGDGLKDRVTEFSVAITGSYWYAPLEDDLAAALGG